MEYQMELRNMEVTRVAFTKYKGDVRKANKMFPVVFQSIRGNNNGAPFFAYYDMNAENKIALTLPYREVYIKGPGMVFKGNPDKYITEVVFPIQED